ncbi:hypothetical protein [Celerinatantimonas sp. YJH-8]|uniref:hypothetical protein n=1 Tax=Celerinatantimonas sp. YJH-8 TaxID=3228714 RepID=UPI0038C8DECD
MEKKLNTDRHGRTAWLQWLSKPQLKGLIIGLAGGLATAIIPLWQVYYVNVADVKAEIGSIQLVHQPDHRFALNSDALKLLGPYLPGSKAILSEPTELDDYPLYTLDELQEAYRGALRHLANQSNIIAELQEHIATINAYLDPQNHHYLLTEFRVLTLKEWHLDDYLDREEVDYYQTQVLALTRDYPSMTFHASGEPKINRKGLSFLLEDLKEDLQDAIQNINSQLNKLRNNIQSIASHLASLSRQQNEEYSYFKIMVVASNVGRVSASMQMDGLLRIDFGQSNYLNLPLKMDDYRSQAEIPAYSTQIIVFRTPLLAEFSSDERRLIYTLWGGTGNVRLLTLDTQGHIYVSKAKAFLHDQSQKEIFDKLTAALKTASN